MKRKNDGLYEGMERFYNTVSGNSNEKAVLTCLGIVLMIPIVTILSYWIDGTLTQYLWNNLVIHIPTFAPLGLKPIEFWEAIAISTSIGYFTKTSTYLLATKADLNNAKPKDERSPTDAFVNMINYLILRPIFFYIFLRILLYYLGLPG